MLCQKLLEQELPRQPYACHRGLRQETDEKVGPPGLATKTVLPFLPDCFPGSGWHWKSDSHQLEMLGNEDKEHKYFELLDYEEKE